MSRLRARHQVCEVQGGAGKRHARRYMYAFATRQDARANVERQRHQQNRRWMLSAPRPGHQHPRVIRTYRPAGGIGRPETARQRCVAYVTNGNVPHNGPNRQLRGPQPNNERLSCGPRQRASSRRAERGGPWRRPRQIQQAAGASSSPQSRERPVCRCSSRIPAW